MFTEEETYHHLFRISFDGSFNAECLLSFRFQINAANSSLQVLHLYGIESLAINGEIPFHQRDKRVKDLYDDKHPARVLIFSAVAAVGLNLAIADVVIFFVSCFILTY
jgi:superfamily II DNA/RNA helicase